MEASRPADDCSLETNTPKQVNVTVSTNSAPTITNQPASQVVLAGTNVLFDVGVAGSVPLSYQWWFNTTNRLAGGTNISLTISNAQPADDGNYSVIVTNAAGNATSSVAVLQVFTSAAATLNSLTLSSSNEFGFGLTGVPGFNYAVLASSNLADWQALLTNAAPFTFTDTNVPPFPSRFYRALYFAIAFGRVARPVLRITSARASRCPARPGPASGRGPSGRRAPGGWRAGRPRT